MKSSDLIIRAGDMGSPEVLEELRANAPTFAVRGNNDTQAWAASKSLKLESGGSGCCIRLGSSAESLSPTVAAVVFGHTHEPWVKDRNGVLYINPGSVGPRRFKLPVTVGRPW